MKVRWVLCLVLGLLAANPASAAEGTFRGRVVDPPANERAVPGWIFVQGKNQMLRRVEVAHAQIVFGEDVPVSQQRKCKAECLSPGQEVRVTASQDAAGEWRAKRVEILRLANTSVETPLKALNFTKLYPLSSATPDNQLGGIPHRIAYGRNLIKVSVWQGGIMSVSSRSPVCAGVCL